MPNVIVSCTFNPPVVSIIGAALRAETVDSLERSLPTCTTTSAADAHATSGAAPKFIRADFPPHTWRMSLGPHYCDQKGAAAVFAVVMRALAAEGWEMRTTNAVNTDGKDVTRLFFWKQA